MSNAGDPGSAVYRVTFPAAQVGGHGDQREGKKKAKRASVNFRLKRKFTLAPFSASGGGCASYRGLRLRREAGRLRLILHPEPSDVTAVSGAAGERVT